jgi:putative CocE/NonD family hydrolase
MALSNEKIQLESVYVPMPDGVRIAVDIWLPADLPADEKIPAIFVFTRYWRAYGLVEDSLEIQPPYRTALYLAERGYALVAVDGRGSGASFGVRTSEYSPAEIADLAPLLDWVAEQRWCNGKIASWGTSYTGNTAFIAAGAGSDALKIVAANSADFDAYSQLMFPGGVPNAWMQGTWGEMVGAMDRNDVQTLMNMAAESPPEEFMQNMRGVRPVDEDADGSLLAAAVAEHAKNFNIGLDTLDLTSRDASAESEAMLRAASIYGYLDSIAKSGTPILYRTGWQDAGTAEGALCLFNSLPNPMQVVIGPWDHGMSSRADPYQPGEEAQPLPLEEKLGAILESIAGHLVPETESSPNHVRSVRYYTYGADEWKSTSTWPPAGIQSRSFYLAENGRLNPQRPTDEAGQDVYRVDPDASTGRFNRWHTQVGGAFVHHPDRREENGKLLVYETAPLDADTEVTGHPLLRLFVRSTAADGAFFAYLEDVDPDGRVRLITEGCLRALHRKISSDAPPYWTPGAYRSYKRLDTAPMQVGEVNELTFNLFPTSVLFRKGHRIRLAIAGADKDTFAPIAGAENAEITVERNYVYASCLELPIMPNGEENHDKL